MFFLKKALTPFILPLAVCLGILILGQILLWLSRRQRAARILVLAGTVLLFASSIHAVSDRLLAPLEYQFPPLLDPQQPAYSDGREGEPIRWIFVLGGGNQSHARLPATSHLTDASLVRVAEGIRLLRLLPESRVIFSGGPTSVGTSESRAMANLARQLGVESFRIVTESESFDTEGQARVAPRLVGKDRFILVTSAAHMPRSMALFRRQGLQPIPAPTDHSILPYASFEFRHFVPKVSALDGTQTVVYERVGYLWAWLRGLTAEQP